MLVSNFNSLQFFEEMTGKIVNKVKIKKYALFWKTLALTLPFQFWFYWMMILKRFIFSECMRAYSYTTKIQKYTIDVTSGNVKITK